MVAKPTRSFEADWFQQRQVVTRADGTAYSVQTKYKLSELYRKGSVWSLYIGGTVLHGYRTKIETLLGSRTFNSSIGGMVYMGLYLDRC